MSLLSKEEILSPKHLKTLDLDVPELGGTVRIREMTAAERDEFSAAYGQFGEEKQGSDLLALSASYALIDTKGNWLFPGADGRDALRALSVAALTRIHHASLTINGISKEETEKIEKNSASNQAAASPSV